MEEKYCSFNPILSNYNDYTDDNYFTNIFTSLYSLLLTPKGSHSYDPEFGTDIRSFILELDSGNLSSRIESSVKSAIQLYLPEVYPMTAVICSREVHSSGIGYKYKLYVVISNTVVNFNISKEGDLILSGIING